jgi:hypothetical protein
MTPSVLRVQEHLRSGGTIDDLAQWYDIRARRHSRHPNLVLLKYNQIGSPFHEPLVRECRGIVLDEADDWRVVSRAFDKFFNHGEALAASIDWSTARVQEKVDGSLCVLYWYADRWHVATTGTPDGCGPVGSPDAGTFAEYFWRTLSVHAERSVGPECEHLADPSFCYYFEICGPLNRIVVEHKKPHLWLLGARECDSGREVSASVACNLLAGDVDVPPVRSFLLGSFDEIAATFGSIRPLEQEGYVVVDGDFRRVKVKHPGYVVLHHAKEGISTRAFVEIARSGEVPEFIAAFPELRPRLLEVAIRLGRVIGEHEAAYWLLRDIAVQKDFALAVKAAGVSSPGALFAVRAKKATSVREFFARDAKVDHLIDVLGLRDEPAQEQP